MSRHRRFIALAGSLDLAIGVFGTGHDWRDRYEEEFGTLIAERPWYAMRVAGLDFSVVLVPMSGLWLVVGAVLLRGSPRRGPSIA